MKSKLRKLKIERGSLDLVIVDYLQLMSGAGSKFAGNRVQEISEISRGLKELARDLKIPIIALSQLSRNVESRVDKKPNLSDLRESGAIEQDADMVLMLYRDDYYDPDTDRKGIADILIRKNRNGVTGEVPLMFKGDTMKFYELQS
jgi:replicative DNA helicase